MQYSGILFNINIFNTHKPLIISAKKVLCKNKDIVWSTPKKINIKMAQI